MISFFLQSVKSCRFPTDFPESARMIIRMHDYLHSLGIRPVLFSRSYKSISYRREYLQDGVADAVIEKVNLSVLPKSVLQIQSPY